MYRLNNQKKFYFSLLTITNVIIAFLILIRFIPERDFIVYLTLTTIIIAFTVAEGMKVIK